ncbi:hypothetical protein ACO0KY_14165 [Undibacterium sp. Dicai25W]|uniref:hypothetical protein n=1 Tax=Undibacterium sp. Dicai25W TaxID=3413034 RepID=UPI003BF45499
MSDPTKQNASNEGGKSFTKLAGGVKSETQVLRCGVQHISRLRKELEANDLTLKSSSGESQLSTLLKVLIYLGERGLNTKEGEGLGYFRIATRIQDLEMLGHRFASIRESIIGVDGLQHRNIARYILISPSDLKSPQSELDLG